MTEQERWVTELAAIRREDPEYLLYRITQGAQRLSNDVAHFVDVVQDWEGLHPVFLQVAERLAETADEVAAYVELASACG